MSAARKLNPFAILDLWQSGNDTATIAKRLGLRESEVANTLAAIRDAARAPQ